MRDSTFIREIEAGERAMELLGGCVVGPCRVLRSTEETEVNVVATGHDSGGEMVSCFADALKAPAASGDHVGGVLRSRAAPKIDAPIVEAVPVGVVHLLARKRSGDKPVHVSRPPVMHPSGVPSATLSLLQVPTNAGDKVVIGRVDNGELPSPALPAERDEPSTFRRVDALVADVVARARTRQMIAEAHAMDRIVSAFLASFAAPRKAQS